jgi:5-methylcytosine-specific restriction endonuclease McrA
MKVLESYKEFTSKIRAKYFGYEIVKTEPIENLYKYKDHRRLQTFYHKGLKCVECGREATQIGHGLDKMGDIHIDVYTDDFFPLNVDHIIPKSKGGSNTLENYQPMCVKCNQEKGNGDDNTGRPKKTKRQIRKEIKKWIGENPESRDIEVGDVVYKSTYGDKLGEVEHILEHPFQKGRMGVKIKGNKTSIYSMNQVFKKLD